MESDLLRAGSENEGDEVGLGYDGMEGECGGSKGMCGSACEKYDGGGPGKEEEAGGGSGGSKGGGQTGSGGKSSSESSASELCGWMSGIMTGVSYDRT